MRLGALHFRCSEHLMVLQERSGGLKLNKLNWEQKHPRSHLRFRLIVQSYELRRVPSVMVRRNLCWLKLYDLTSCNYHDLKEQQTCRQTSAALEISGELFSSIVARQNVKKVLHCSFLCRLKPLIGPLPSNNTATKGVRSLFLVCCTSSSPSSRTWVTGSPHLMMPFMM